MKLLVRFKWEDVNIIILLRSSENGSEKIGTLLKTPEIIVQHKIVCLEEYMSLDNPNVADL